MSPRRVHPCMNPKEDPVPERIVVAYDGSVLSREAFAYATMLAEASGARVHGLTVLEREPPPRVVVSDSGDELHEDVSTAPTPDAQRDLARSALDELERHCAGRGIEFSSSVRYGGLLESLFGEAGQEDLIAVGMAGRFSDAGFGSTTRSLSLESPCPVLIAGGPLRPVNRLLAVYDGAEQSRHAVEWSRDTAAQCGWPLSVLAVAGAVPQDRALDEAEQLAPDAQILHPDGDAGTEADQIRGMASRASYALLVIGAYADSKAHQLLFGGTTGRVLKQVDAPVVLVR
jgi:nucleotide-binding universal stress UspA family protein